MAEPRPTADSSHHGTPAQRERDDALPAELIPLRRLLERAEGFALAFVRCNAPVEAERLARVLAREVRERDAPPRIVQLEGDTPRLLASLQELDPPPRPGEALLVLGFERSIPAEGELPGALSRINLNRERFRELPGPLVLFLPDYALTRLAREAQDFWAWRSGVFEVKLDRLALDQAVEHYSAPNPYRDLSPAAQARHLRVLEGLLEELEEEPSPQRFDVLLQLAGLAGAMGDVEPGLAYAEEAVKIARALKDEKLIAMGLAANSFLLEDSEQFEEAVSTGREAVNLYRSLAKHEPDRYEPTLAGNLLNLSNYLETTGHQNEALTAIQEAVEIHRRLAAANPGRYDPDLALSLNNLSVHLAAAGDGADALAAIREAVEIARHLAESDPARYESELAQSLNNLSLHLTNAGDATGARTAIQEAVKIRRRLAASNPARYASDLVKSLHSLSNRLAEVGDGAGALAAIQEAVEICRRLAASNPALSESDLAMSLNNLSNRLAEAGDGAGALAAIREAVEICRRLAALNPARYEAGLAKSLNNLSLHLAELGEGAGALGASQEAVEIYRRLAESNSARYEPDLAGSLYNLSLRLAEAGDDAGALAVVEEAARLIEPYAAKYPESPWGQWQKVICARLTELDPGPV